jgi:hypothetical protein
MGRKRDLKEVDRAARQAGIPPELRRDFGRFLERCKRDGDTGTKNDRGDFTYDELLDKARDFLAGLNN